MAAEFGAVLPSRDANGVPLARTGEFRVPRIGPLRVWPPVVLAPMAGVTNWPFRSLCRGFGAALYVSEMITARPLVEGHPKTRRLASFGPDETPRSLQLYGIDPPTVARAVEWLVGEGRVDHVDLNFGCPVRKVTRLGGGAAIPAKPRLLREIVRSAVRHAARVPVTIKFRIGIDDARSTFLESGRIAQEEGCAAVALHARTAAQLYAGEARWEAIAELKAAVRHVPVLGNGDVFEARDALRMMRATGCDGVVVGRGCLGRPWLFRDLADAFEGCEPAPAPRLGEVVPVMLDHAGRLVDWLGETRGVRMFRKHAGWYTKGYAGGARLRQRLVSVSTLSELADVLEQADPRARVSREAVRAPRGKSGGTQRVVLPEGYLDDPEDATPPCAEAESAISGG